MPTSGERNRMTSGLRAALEVVDAGHVEPHAALSRAHFADAFPSDPGHIAWKHLTNPQGPALAWHLYDGDRLVGRIVYQVREFRLGGRTLRSGYLTDLLIHPAHRGLPHFLALMRRIREIPDLDFVWVTPNAVSGPLFRKAVRLAGHHGLRVVACPVRTAPVLAQLAGATGRRVAPLADAALGAFLIAGAALAGRRPSGLVVTDARPSDTELDALDAAYAAAADLAGRRDARFHDWRFRDGPIFRTRVLYCRRDGALAGYVAVRDQDYLGFRARFLVDVCFARGTPAAVLRHLRWRVLADARRDGRELVLGIFNTAHPALRAFCGPPFATVPERHLPQGVDLWFERTAPGVALPDDPARWYVTLADLDVF